MPIGNGLLNNDFYTERVSYQKQIKLLEDVIRSWTAKMLKNLKIQLLILG